MDRYVEDVISRYVYDVCRRLNKTQRVTAEKDIREQIDNLLKDREMVRQRDIDDALTQLGNPATYANKYIGKNTYIVSPGLYDTYLILIKTILIVVFCGMTLSFIVKLSFGFDNYVELLLNYITLTLLGIIQTLGLITLIFVFLEKIDKKNKLDYQWNPIHLPVIPKKLIIVSKGESMTSIVIALIFLIIFSAAPEFIAYYVFADQTYIIPIFNLDTMKRYILLINIMFALVIIKEIFKLYAGRITLSINIMVFIVNIIIIVIIICVFNTNSLWNYDFVDTIVAIPGINATQENINTAFTLFRGFIVVLFSIPIFIDTTSTIYKSIKCFILNK